MFMEVCTLTTQIIFRVDDIIRITKYKDGNAIIALRNQTDIEGKKSDGILFVETVHPYEYIRDRIFKFDDPFFICKPDKGITE